MASIHDFEHVELHTSGYGATDHFVKEYLVDWEDLGGFLKALKGGYRAINENTWTFDAPDRCTEPGFDTFYCVDARFGSYGKSWWDETEERSFWEKAKVTAEYRRPLFTTGQDEIAEQDLDFSVEQITIPPNSLSVDDTPLDQPIKVMIPLCAYTITLYDVPNLPGGNANGIISLLGYVNEGGFHGADPGKMLFMGARTSRRVTTGGARAWRIEYKFLYRPRKWTEVLANQGGSLTWVEPVDADGKKLYESTSFGRLNIPRI